MLLKIDNLTGGYGEREVIKNISIEVDSREIVCILGANGAGKSTIIKSIMGYIKPIKGTITFENESLVGLPSYEIVKRGISYVAQGNLIFPDLTVFENLRMGAFLEKDKRKFLQNMNRAYELFPVLGERRNQKAGTLSGGERQMLGISMQLMTDTKLLILDEPSFGLSPVFRENIFDNLAKLNRNGITILIAEQNVVNTLELANRGYIIELGKVMYQDSVENLARNRQKIWQTMLK